MQLTVRKAQSEQFLYNCAKFPSFFGHGHTSVFPNHTALAHWHDDIEFSIVLSGRMDYNVNGEFFRLNQGDGIFVNTRQIHYNFSANRKMANTYAFCCTPCSCALPSTLRTLS